MSSIMVTWDSAWSQDSRVHSITTSTTTISVYIYVVVVVNTLYLYLLLPVHR